MKALAINSFIKDYDELRVTNIPAPVPKPDQVLVNICYSALNHVDLLYAKGLHQNNHAGLIRPPFVLGLEFSGIVVSAPASSGLKPGDEVWGTSVGGFAEQIAVPVKNVWKLPKGWTLKDAAGVGAGTAPVSYGAFRLANVKPGQTVLVHAAAGGLGVVGVQIAKGMGARVIGTVGSEEKAEVVRKLGVVGVVRYDKDGWEKEVVALAGNGGVDVVYDTVGLVLESIRCCKFGGSIVIAGFAGRGGKMETLTMNRILLKGVKLIGYRYGETSRRIPKETEATWQGLNDLVEQGHIKPVICKTYVGLNSIPDALKDLYARKVWGKAVVEINAQATSRL